MLSPDTNRWGDGQVGKCDDRWCDRQVGKCDDRWGDRRWASANKWAKAESATVDFESRHPSCSRRVTTPHAVSSLFVVASGTPGDSLVIHIFPGMTSREITTLTLLIEWS